MVLTQEEGRHPGGGDGIIARTLFTYGKTAPAVPRITARRRIHHPSPGPHDQPVGGVEVLADPQEPPMVNVVQENELIFWSVPMASESDQNGRARETKTKTIARPRAIREGPSASTRVIPVRHGEPGRSIGFPQGARWINNVR